MNTMEDNSKLLIDAAKNGDVLQILRFLENNTLDYNCEAMYAAIDHNHASCVRALIGDPPSALGAEPLRKALSLGHLECIKELVDFSDPQGCIHEVLHVKNMECLVAVLPAYTPQCLGEMFEWLLKQHEVPHHLEKIELLKPFADPRVFEGYALKCVSEAGHTHLIDALYSTCNPNRALAHLKRENPNNPKIWEYLESKIQARRIASEIDRRGVSVVRKM